MYMIGATLLGILIVLGFRYREQCERLANMSEDEYREYFRTNIMGMDK